MTILLIFWRDCPSQIPTQTEMTLQAQRGSTARSRTGALSQGTTSTWGCWQIYALPSLRTTSMGGQQYQDSNYSDLVKNYPCRAAPVHQPLSLNTSTQGETTQSFCVPYSLTRSNILTANGHKQAQKLLSFVLLTSMSLLIFIRRLTTCQKFFHIHFLQYPCK